MADLRKSKVGNQELCASVSSHQNEQLFGTLNKVWLVSSEPWAHYKYICKKFQQNILPETKFQVLSCTALEFCRSVFEAK